ncbi:MAG: hypothetical protein LBR53_03075 [Deltaproteobacteria bacterium]|jgi:chaperonin cofactor prefoldin|nr:hypothetical protein [Deltaproteobacteria bacterium]
MSFIKVLLSVVGVILLLLFLYLWRSNASESAQLNAKLAELQNQFNSLSSERDALNSDLGQIKTQLTDAQQKLTQAQRQATQLESDNQDLKAQSRGYQSSMVQLEDQLNICKKAAEALETPAPPKSDPAPPEGEGGAQAPGSLSDAGAPAVPSAAPTGTETHLESGSLSDAGAPPVSSEAATETHLESGSLSGAGAPPVSSHSGTETPAAAGSLSDSSASTPSATEYQSSPPPAAESGAHDSSAPDSSSGGAHQEVAPGPQSSNDADPAESSPAAALPASDGGCAAQLSTLQTQVSTLLAERDTLKAGLLKARENLVAAASGSYTPKAEDQNNDDLSNLSSFETPIHDPAETGAACSASLNELANQVQTLTLERDGLKNKLAAARGNLAGAASGAYTPSGYDLMNTDLDNLSDIKAPAPFAGNAPAAGDSGRLEDDDKDAARQEGRDARVKASQAPGNSRSRSPLLVLQV